MKRILVFCLVFFFLFISVKGIFAQPVEGIKFEFSTSFLMGNVKGKGGIETGKVFNIPLRIGLFVCEGLEFEPELLLTVTEDSDRTGVLFSGNLVYNFKASKKVNIFVLGGFGLGNLTQSFSRAFNYSQNIVAKNFGGGIKYVIGSFAGIRFEYRLASYSEFGNHLRTDHNIYLGMSIFH